MARWPRAEVERVTGRSNALLETKLSIDIAPVAHRRDVHQAFGIIDAVYNAPISHPKSPHILRALELLAAARSRCCRQCFDAAKDPSCYGPVKRLQLLSG
jgi:hypothetical protein